MALIVGYVNPEEKERLERAGYEVHKYIGQNLIHPYKPAASDEITVAVTVNCEILELLAPNFCQRCGSFMEDVQTYYEGGSKITSYSCGVCRSVENRVLFAPAKEEKMGRRIHKLKRYIRVYPNEWSMAGQVVGWLITIPYSYEFYLSQVTDGWDASFQHPGDRGGQAHASTAPLAIYQAALKALEEEVYMGGSLEWVTYQFIYRKEFLITVIAKDKETANIRAQTGNWESVELAGYDLHYDMLEEVG